MLTLHLATSLTVSESGKALEQAVNAELGLEAGAMGYRKAETLGESEEGRKALSSSPAVNLTGLGR